MRSKISIPFIASFSTAEDIRVALDNLPVHPLREASWMAYPYLPFVHFKIGYTAKAVVLTYEVKEKDRKADYKVINDPVYKDSCVEFFISFDRVHYYNFEFNSIGTALVGYGTEDRAARVRLPAQLIETIKATSAIEDRAVGEEQQWTLTLEIPFTLFYKDAIDSLKGVQATANFYKCGDDLPEPHFVSWNRIEAAAPNFHLPAYFGEIEFV